MESEPSPSQQDKKKWKLTSTRTEVLSDNHNRYFLDTNNLLEQNKFYLLEETHTNDNESNSQSDNNPKTITKVPPYLHQVNNQPIIDDLLKIIENFTTQYKNLSLRINLTNVENYRKLTQYYNEQNIQNHTFRCPENNCVSVVIRNIPVSISTDDIMSELNNLNFPVQKVTRLLNKNKSPMPLCVVDLIDNDSAA